MVIDEVWIWFHSFYKNGTVMETQCWGGAGGAGGGGRRGGRNLIIRLLCGRYRNRNYCSLHLCHNSPPQEGKKEVKTGMLSLLLEQSSPLFLKKKNILNHTLSKLEISWIHRPLSSLQVEGCKAYDSSHWFSWLRPPAAQLRSRLHVERTSVWLRRAHDWNPPLRLLHQRDTK